MLLNQRFSASLLSITEIAVADLGAFQIIVPTFRPAVDNSFKLTGSATSRRTYSTEGWVTYQDAIIGTLAHLEIGDTSEPSPWRSLKRLGPAVPLTFEIKSPRSLPSALLTQSTLAYQFHHELIRYYALFQNIQPHFVRIYSVSGAQPQQLLLKARQCRIDVAQFVAQNREHLQRVPFYREAFGL